MKSTSTMFKALLGGGLLLGFALVGPAAAQTGPTLASPTFFGGAGDQRGTAVAVGGGALYLSGNVQPGSHDPSAAAWVLKYALPSSPVSAPVWAKPYGFGTNFFGIAATDEGVYADGFNYSLTTDGVGGKEPKSILAKFAPDGLPGPAPGGATWLALPNFFAYTGVEMLTAATTAVEGSSLVIYAVGGGQPCSYSAYLIAKFDASSGNLLARATDPGQEPAFNSCYYDGIGSGASGVTVLNGNVYAVGGKGGHATIWKHAPDLSVVWRQQATGASWNFLGVTAFGGAIYAVGNTYTPGAPNSEDYLVQKYDEAGTLVWSRAWGGSATDILTGVAVIHNRLFAVGHTRSTGTAGGADAVIFELDPANGSVLHQLLWGGSYDDMANGAATDGTDLYVVGESRSYATAEGNVAGQNDVFLLRYTPAPIAVAIDIKPGTFPNSINVNNKGNVPVAILTSAAFDAANVDPATARFGITGTEAAPLRSALKDVDGDGDADLILQFDTQATGIHCGDTSASLTGKTLDGQMIQGSDAITTVGCK